jgi:hypothetical protein
MYNNRKLVIATKQEKEIVIVPLLEKELGVQYVFFRKISNAICQPVQN